MVSADPWVTSAVVSSFDENKGPVIEFCYPSDSLSASLLNEIKMLSLPRVGNSKPENCFFVFRVRTNEEVGYLDRQFYEHEYLYGYVYFQ